MGACRRNQRWKYLSIHNLKSGMQAAAAAEAAPMRKESEEYHCSLTPHREARSLIKWLSLWRVRAAVWRRNRVRSVGPWVAR